jgi:hypothetical protein
MHPLIGDLTSLKDSEVDQKISELTGKYFATSNTELKAQIAMALDTYKLEQSNRQQANYAKMMSTRNKDLDKLINVQ